MVTVPGRSWWTSWLGADRDPDAAFQVEEPQANRSGERRRRVRLVSCGTELSAMLVAPDGPGPFPAVVVPFYDVPTVFGERTRRTRDWTEAKRRSCASGRHLVDRGFAVLAVPWWCEHDADPDDDSTALWDRYGPPATRHAATSSRTGLGRSVADLLLAVDALLTVPEIDPGRVGVFGHSLGGKLAMHLAAFDVRVRAGVVHEPGLGFDHSNWSDPWYLGTHIPADRDQDDLLRLVAPRPVLIAGGGASDGRHNEGLVDRARSAWGDGTGMNTLYHDNGHTPPDHILAACYSWLAAHLGGPDPTALERNSLP